MPPDPVVRGVGVVVDESQALAEDAINPVHTFVTGELVTMIPVTFVKPEGIVIAAEPMPFCPLLGQSPVCVFLIVNE